MSTLGAGEPFNELLGLLSFFLSFEPDLLNIRRTLLLTFFRTLLTELSYFCIWLKKNGGWLWSIIFG